MQDIFRNLSVVTSSGKNLKIIIGAVGLVLLLLGCGEKIENLNELTLAYPADIRGFDPAFATDFRSGRTMSFVYDNLVRFGDSTNLEPCVARAWEMAPDGKTYTFHLHPEAKFDDGTPITAAAVRWSLTRVLLPELASPQTWLFSRIKGAEDVIAGNTGELTGVEAVNDTTLIIRLDAPFAPFIQYLAMPSASIVNPTRHENIQLEPAGSGPWKLEKWERDGELIFVRNEAYWSRKPLLERLRIRILSEPMTRSAEFEAGNLDINEVSIVEIDSWRSDPKWEKYLITTDDISIYYIGLNCSRPPFNDVRVRRALNLALDREKILKVLRFGVGIQAAGPVPPSLLKSPPPKPYPFDPDSAISLLAEAGYPDGLESQLWVAGDAEMYHVLEAFQSYWKAVGVRVELLRSDWNVFRTGVKIGKPDMYYLSWFADYPDGENFLYPLFNSAESMAKRNRFSNAEIDSLIDRVQRLPEGPERDRVVARANRRVMEEAPWVFLWHPQNNTLLQPNVKGYVPQLIFNAQRYLDITKEKS